MRFIPFFIWFPLALVMSLMQNGAPKPASEPPAEVRITAEQAKPFRAQIEKAERTTLEIRALTAEIRVAQTRVRELQTQSESEQASIRQTLQSLAEKAGIKPDQMKDYDLSDDGEGLKLVKRKKE